MFGIIWGTVAVILLVAVSIGMKRQMSITMHGMGESISVMFANTTTKPFEGFGIGRRIFLYEEDAKLLTTFIPEIESLSPEYIRGGVPTRVGENILNPAITGIYPSYGNMRNVIAEAGGRFINDLDIEHRKRVVVLGDEVKTFLFGESDAIGKIIFVGDVPFTVIGVMMKKIQSSSYNQRDLNRIFIPATTFSAVFGTIRLSNIIYKPKDPTHSEEVEVRVREILAKRYKFDPTDKEAIWIWDTAEFDRFIFYFSLGFTIFMALIGSFTLGIAGLGVANIMFIVVQERVKEIGIKRAVGATRFNIILQLFSETFFIIGIGAAIGFTISLGFIAALQKIPLKDYIGTPVLSLEVVMIAVSVLTIVGLLAGLMPARRASKLDVVECLRT
jgi:putative ABC transport system permease protein